MKPFSLSPKILTKSAWFVIFFAAVFMTTAICSANDLVLHLTFDELRGDVAEDISKFGNDATFQGDVELITGKHGKALEFDGASWGEIPDNDSLDMVDGITIHFWTNIRPSAGGQGSDVQTGVEKGTTWKAGLYTLAAYYRGGSLLQFFDLPDNCREHNKGQVYRTKNGTTSQAHGMAQPLSYSLMVNSIKNWNAKVHLPETVNRCSSVLAAETNVSSTVRLTKLKCTTIHLPKRNSERIWKTRRQRVYSRKIN